MALCFFVLVLVFGQNLPCFDIASSVVRWKNACFPLFYVCKSRNSGNLSRKSPRQTDFFGAKWDFGREFLASWREKHPEKGGFCPQSGRIGRKRAVLGGKSQGGDEAKKRTWLPILQCYEVAKWAQMNFSRIFFRRSLAGNAEMPYLCTRNREATLLQERVTLWFATRQQKCCCDLWKSYITDCREVQGTIDHEAFFLSGKKLLRVKWIVPSNSTPK